MKPPTLDPGEDVVDSFRANRSQGRRAVGGWVFLTTTHLRFRPHAIDANTGGRTWAVARPEVTGVDVADRDPAGLFSGGGRRRLRVRTAGGDELFVVNGAGAKADALRQALGLAPPG